MSARLAALPAVVAVILTLLLMPVAASAQGGDSGPDIILFDSAINLGIGFANISVADDSAGLASIGVINLTNASATVPPFQVGSTDPAIVHLEQIDPAVGFGVGLGACNTANECSQAQFQFSPDAQPLVALARIPEPRPWVLTLVGVIGLFVVARHHRKVQPAVA